MIVIGTVWFGVGAKFGNETLDVEEGGIVGENIG